MEGQFSSKGPISRFAQLTAQTLSREGFFAFTLFVLALWAAVFVYRTFFWFDRVPYFSLFDDGMVSMRYALNLVEGNGLVWNAGDFVEGYTNPLWTLYMAAVIASFGKHFAPLGMQVTGLLLMIATVALAACAARDAWPPEEEDRISPRTLALGAALMLVPTLYPLQYWSLMGMEVSALAALAAGSALILIRVETGRSTAIRGLMLILAAIVLSYFTRPDGFLILIPLFVVCALRALQQAPRQMVIVTLVGGALIISLALAHFVWRLQFYGALMPNTYTLKVTGYSLSLRLSNGFGFISIFFSSYWPVIIAAGLLLVLSAHHRLLGGVFFTSMILSLAYQIYVGGDPWLYWRQLAPGLVLLYIGLAINIAAVLKRASEHIRPIVFLIALCATFVVCIATNRAFLRQIVGLDLPYSVSANRINIATAIALRDVLQPNAMVLSFWAGALPYYWGGNAIDPLGKADTYIARLPVDLSISAFGMKGLPGHAKYDFNHSVVQARPDYIQNIGPWYIASAIAIDKQYVRADYKGVSLCLRIGSPLVRWSMVDVMGSC